jgi:N,N'-diacetyllegionaminate synthase
MFNSVFKIGEREVGGDSPVLVIAEAGVAHFGDMKLAKQLVDLSVEAEADIFKIQIFDVDSLISKEGNDWKDRLRLRNLTFEDTLELKKYCDSKDIMFMATAHDETRISWLEKLDVPAVKIGSGEKNNLHFIKKLVELGKPIILSTGMYNNADVTEILDFFKSLGCENLSLLQCTTSYPTPPEQVNLLAMKTLSSLFEGPVGYSDHTTDDLAVLSAVAMGAKIIERHITILTNIENAQDWKVSSGPGDFPELVKKIRRVEKIRGSYSKQPQECEHKSKIWALKSLVANRDLNSGETIKEEDLVVKRPGGGIEPNKIKDVIGKKINKPVDKDSKIFWNDID